MFSLSYLGQSQLLPLGNLVKWVKRLVPLLFTDC